MRQRYAIGESAFDTTMSHKRNVMRLIAIRTQSPSGVKAEYVKKILISKKLRANNANCWSYDILCDSAVSRYEFFLIVKFRNSVISSKQKSEIHNHFGISKYIAVSLRMLYLHEIYIVSVINFIELNKFCRGNHIYIRQF